MNKFKLLTLLSGTLFLVACSNQSNRTTESTNSSSNTTELSGTPASTTTSSGEVLQTVTIDDGKEYKLAVTRADGTVEEYPYEKNSLVNGVVEKEDGSFIKAIHFKDLEGNAQSVEINEGDTYEVVER